MGDAIAAAQRDGSLSEWQNTAFCCNCEGAATQAAMCMTLYPSTASLKGVARYGRSVFSLYSAAKRLLPAAAIYFMMDEQDVQRIIAHPRSMIGSDGIPSNDMPHPRLWGTFPRVLGHYARDLKLISLEQAVHKMTGLTARVFGMMDRGAIREGAYADLVLFDPETVIDTATFAAPKTPARGIMEVWVNGVSSYVGKTGLTGASTGRLITRNVA